MVDQLPVRLFSSRVTPIGTQRARVSLATEDGQIEMQARAPELRLLAAQIAAVLDQMED